MTTFADMLTKTAAITGRPELVALTKIAVRTATIRAHCTTFFPRDKFAQTVNYTVDNTSQWNGNINVFTAFASLRQLKVVQCVDSNGAVTEQLTYREVDDLYDTSGYLRDSTWKLEGQNLLIHSRAPTGSIKVHGYTLPSVAEDSYSSWIADSYPEELALWAAAIVQFRSGNQEIAGASLKTNVEPFKELLIISHEQIIPD